MSNAKGIARAIEKQAQGGNIDTTHYWRQYWKRVSALRGPRQPRKGETK